jgi:hypothetical protein
MNTREAFNRNKELAAWWRSITTDTRFEEVQMYARSAFLDLLPSAEELKGAKLLEELQISLVDAESAGQELPNPGLHHQIEPLPIRPDYASDSRTTKTGSASNPGTGTGFPGTSASTISAIKSTNLTIPSASSGGTGTRKASKPVRKH